MEKVAPFIKIEKLTKVFGKVVANNNVDLTINGGEIHALLGENGAGKSTLMNMLSGVYSPDGGKMYVHGDEAKFASPKDAIKAGVGMIYQHFKLVDAMTALENILVGQKGKVFIDKKSAKKEIEEIINRLDLNVELSKYVHDMSVGEKQNLEILKVLYRGANILILDEPTTVFTPQESVKLFNIINKMKNDGCAIIFISHKMDEVMEVADKVTVLRKGESIKTLNKKDTNPKELTDLMVGKAVDLSIERTERNGEEKLLEIKDLIVLDEEKIEKLKGVSIDVRKGEILGIAGIAGSGQKEICEAIAGIQKVQKGEINFDGENIVGKTPREIITKGISMSFIPEDRLGMGLVASMDMVDNVLLKEYQKQKGLFINRKPVIKKAEEMVERLQIKTPSVHYPIKYLSGGNIQKILLGRELSLYPKLLIMAYPVRGLDVSTCHTIYDLVNIEKQKGNSVIYIAEDLDVLIELCDRIAVVYNGKITGVVDAENVTKEEIGLLMVGNKLEKEKK